MAHERETGLKAMTRLVGPELMAYDATLRDYFAATAMAGLAFCLDTNERGTVGVAKIAYELADAMLKERAK